MPVADRLAQIALFRQIARQPLAADVVVAAKQPLLLYTTRVASFSELP